jgi:selenide,water dikinase
MGDRIPTIKDLVLIGGGHSHVFVLKKFGMKPEPGVKLTLITRDIMTPYSGMLPGHVAGHYTYEECHVDLRPLSRFANARFIHAEANGVDTVEKKIYIKTNDGIPRPPISYDVLSIDIGISPTKISSSRFNDDDDDDNNNNKSTSTSSITPIKPINTFSSRWNNIIERVITNKSSTNIVVVGGGAGGIELTLAMQYKLLQICKEMKKEKKCLPTFTILTRGDNIVSSHNRKVRATCMRILKERNIRVLPNSEVLKSIYEYPSSSSKKKSNKKQKHTYLLCKNGEKYIYDECIWCTSASAQSWLKDNTQLSLDNNGFIAVEDTLESTNSNDVFAAGDIAAVLKYPRAKAGVFAVRQGPPLADNLRYRLRGEATVPFVPQKEFLCLISTGDKYAIASRGCWSFSGAYLWYIKDWIDRTWMTKYTKLPDMALALEKKQARKGHAVAISAGSDAIDVLSHVAMRCGGCGSKIGAPILSCVMKRLRNEIVIHPDVIIGLDAPDDAAVVKGIGENKTAVHTVDFFRSFIDDPFTFGRIAANHALSDCHAMCAEPRTALAIATVPFAVEDKVEETLYQMMSGACLALKDSGCALVGGHSAEGPELSLGFAVNGVANAKDVLRKEGLKIGHKIIITKAVGTGVIFAAEMRGKVNGVAVDDAIRMMCKSNRNAALCLRDHGCKSCTDVTGFGVLGHLVEMVNASEDVSARIQLDKVPFLNGAIECVEKKIFSSLQPQNIRVRRGIDTDSQHIASKYPEYSLLFDPQTAGGLLCGVPANKVSACLEKLHKLGYESSAVIGEVVSSIGVQAGGAIIIDSDGMMNCKSSKSTLKKGGSLTSAAGELSPLLECT